MSKVVPTVGSSAFQPGNTSDLFILTNPESIRAAPIPDMMNLPIGRSRVALPHLISSAAKKEPIINSQARFCGRKKSAAGDLVMLTMLSPKDIAASNAIVTIG
jgi:hypothetical protein